MVFYIDTTTNDVEGKFWLLHRYIEDGTVTKDNICDYVTSYFYGKYYNRIQKMLEYQEKKQKMKGDGHNGK